MSKPVIQHIIKRFLEGECNDEEFAYLLYWYESFEQQSPSPLSQEDKALLKARILERIKRNIPELNHSSAQTSTASKRNGTRAYWWKGLAAAAVVGMIAWAGFLYFGGKAAVTKPSPVGNNDNLLYLSNHSNRVHPLVLPDSSVVWLNPGSSLRYPEKFTGNNRTVKLAGQAFFEIKKIANQPFIVIGAKLKTTVLGTSFLMKAYRDEPAEVTVLSGKVAVSKNQDNGQRLVLEEKQKAILKNDNLYKKQPSDDPVLKRWAKVDLTFEDVPLKKVLLSLNKQFKVNIRCSSSAIQQLSLNADFSHQNLVDILNMLELSLNINYQMVNDSTILLNPSNKTKNKAL